MATPIISTKLYIPRPPHTLVPRPHLTAKLEKGSQGKLVLVSAPAGFGKTSLIAEWSDRCMEKHLVSWIHLDESGNELARFLSYTIGVTPLCKLTGRILGKQLSPGCNRCARTC